MMSIAFPKNVHGINSSLSRATIFQDLYTKMDIYMQFVTYCTTYMEILCQ